MIKNKIKQSRERSRIDRIPAVGSAAVIIIIM